MNIRHVLLTSLLLAQVGCGLSENFSKTKADQKLADRAHSIHQNIVDKLANEFPREEGSIWSSTTIQLNDDWIVQGPDNVWGATADQIPTELDCNPYDSSCDKVFKRQLCETTSDCQTVSTECRPLEASVSQLGQEPTKMCLGMGDALLDRFYKVMIAADEELDLVSLSTPTGRFYTAMINALSVLSQKESVPAVRLLFSGHVAGLPNLLNSTDKIMKEIAGDVQRTAPETFQRLRMNLAWVADGKVSWNHAKIVVADGSLSLQGGHNLWDDKYLNARTIFDLSMEYRGEGAAEARNFVNSLWETVGDKYSSFPKGFGRIAAFNRRSNEVGAIETITLGRMGTFGANVSEKGIQHLIDSAESSVSLIQQDVYNFFVSPLPLFRTFVFDNIVNAAARGVKVEMVLSNQKAFFGYTTVNGTKEYKTFLDALVQKLRREQGIDQSSAQKIACERIVVSPFRFSRNIAYWPSKSDEQPGLHTKFVMVDNAAFYLGSHNLYPANLQEFGNIVTDGPAATQIKNQYWDKVWSESRQAQMSCPY